VVFALARHDFKRRTELVTSLDRESDEARDFLA